MTIRPIIRAGALIGLCVALSACGDSTSRMFSWGGPRTAEKPGEAKVTATRENEVNQGGSTVWDLFGNNDQPDVQIEVNKYLWQASLEVLDFLPIQSVDPFSGLIVTGYGTPPGGGRAYKATIMVTDPALDARSLKVSLESRGGAVSADTVRAVEDAILTRARQIRIRDSKL